MDAAKLPEDVEFKGYADVIVQDIRLTTDNVKFYKEEYYSAKMRQSYQPELPSGYSGQYGPGIRSLYLKMYHGMQASEPKIVEFFAYVGIRISKGEIAQWLTEDQAGFQAESDAVYEAGLNSSPYQQTDDTLTRVDGQNQHCHVVWNPVYTAYHTHPGKDRLTVLDVLRNRRQLLFRINAEALEYMKNQLNWSKAAWYRLHG